MSNFVTLLGVVLMLAISSYVTGRSLVAFVNVRWLRSIRPENMLLSTFLGSTFAMLVTAGCSYLGLSAVYARYVYVGLMTVLILLVALQGRLSWIYQAKQGKRFLPLLVCLVILSVSCMGSAIYSRGYDAFNDATSYISMAEVLQDHPIYGPFGAEVNEHISGMVGIMSSDWFHTGSIFHLSLVRAFFPLHSYQIYPAIIAWGGILNASAIFVLARWTLRIPRRYALLGSIGPLLTLSPLTFSTDTSFLCQLHGTAAFAFSIAVTSRLFTRTHWTFGSALVFALSVAGVLSAYSEFAPILTFACIAYMGLAIVKANRKRCLTDFWLFFGKTVIALALCSHIELIRTIHSIFKTLSLNGVGYPIPWSAAEFWTFALGMRGFNDRLYLHYAVISLIAGALLVMGMFRIFRRTKQAISLATAVATLGALAIFYAFVSRDPWSGEVGHTWNLFKLCKYAFPFVVALEVGGLYALLRNRKHERIALISVCVLLAIAYIPRRIRSVKSFDRHITIIYGENALAGAGQLIEHMRDVKPGKLYVLPDPFNHPNRFAGGLLYPAAYEVLTNDTLEETLPDLADPESFCFMPSRPPFEQPRKSLPLNFSQFDPQSTFVAGVNSGYGLEFEDARAFFWIGEEAVGLRVWCGQEGKFTLRFDVEPGPSIVSTDHRQFRVKTHDGASYTLNSQGKQQLSTEVELTKGITSVHIECTDQGNNQCSTSNPRTLLAKISNVVLERTSEASSQFDDESIETANATASGVR